MICFVQICLSSNYGLYIGHDCVSMHVRQTATCNTNALMLSYLFAKPVICWPRAMFLGFKKFFSYHGRLHCKKLRSIRTWQLVNIFTTWKELDSGSV